MECWFCLVQGSWTAPCCSQWASCRC